MADHHRLPCQPPIDGLYGDSMNFETLSLTSTYYFDDEKKSGIVFHGPDTSEWLQFFLTVGRSEAIAKQAQEAEENEVMAEVAVIDARKNAYIDALTCAFKDVIGITLNDKKVTSKNCRDLFRAMDQNQRIDLIKWLQDRESFTGKR